MPEEVITKAITKNARIVNTNLGKSHGSAFTFSISLDYGDRLGSGGGQNAGHLELGDLNGSWQGAIPMLRAIIDVVGVDSWEDLPDKYVRVKATREKVFAIGNVIEDKWLDFGSFAKLYQTKGEIRGAGYFLSKVEKLEQAIGQQIFIITPQINEDEKKTAEIWNPILKSWLRQIDDIKAELGSAAKISPEANLEKMKEELDAAGHPSCDYKDEDIPDAHKRLLPYLYKKRFVYDTSREGHFEPGELKENNDSIIDQTSQQEMCYRFIGGTDVDRSFYTIDMGGKRRKFNIHINDESGITSCVNPEIKVDKTTYRTEHLKEIRKAVATVNLFSSEAEQHKQMDRALREISEILEGAGIP